MNEWNVRFRRRSPGFRRLLFVGAVPFLLPHPIVVGASQPSVRTSLELAAGRGELTPAEIQEPGGPRLTAREVRVTRSETGDYRILEIIDLAPGSRTKGPLALVELPDVANRFAGAGSGIERTDLRLDESTVSILRWPDETDPVQLLLSYLLPAGTEEIRFVSLLETGEFGVSLARGSVHARVDRRLEPAGQVGSAASPRRRFVTGALEPGTAISVRVGSKRIGWRERLAVLLAATLAVALGAAWVWRN